MRMKVQWPKFEEEQEDNENVIDWSSRGGKRKAREELKSEKDYAACDKGDRDATSAVDPFTQKEFRGNHISHKSKRCGSWRDQADVAPGKSEQQSKEGNRHRGDPKREQRVPQNVADHSEDAMIFPQIANIADLLHSL